MKIALIRRGYSPTGGAERYLLRLAEGLEHEGHECLLVSDRVWPHEVWDEREAILVGGSSPRAFADALRDLDLVSRCDTQLSLERVHHCDVYRAGDGVHAAWLARRAGLEPAWRDAWRRRRRKHRELLELEREMLLPEAKTRVIVNSLLVAGELEQHFGTPAQHIVHIPNGYDPPDWDGERRAAVRREKREGLGLSEAELGVLFVGSGWERKGLREAVEGCGLANRTAEGVAMKLRLFVAGRGRWPRGLATEGVQRLEHQSSLADLLEAMDLFVMPTRYDPFSNACLEAAAHGLPVITTAANGFVEILPDREASAYGSVIPESEIGPEAVAAQLLRWRDLGRDELTAARERIRQLAAPYTVERNVRATVKVLSEGEPTACR